MVNWDDSAKYKLLLTIITELNPSPPNWSNVAAKMGEGYTSESVRQQYQKIKKNAGAEIGTPSAGTPKTATPRMRKAQSTAAASPTPNPTAAKRGRPAKKDYVYVDQQNGEDDDEEDTKPVKKAKTAPAKKADEEDGDEKVKVENVEDDVYFGEEEDGPCV